MSYLKTHFRARKAYCLFFSWSLLMLTRYQALSQQIPLDSSNTNIDVVFPAPSDPSQAELEFSFTGSLGEGSGIIYLEADLALSTPLQAGAVVNHLTGPGHWGYGDPGATISVTLNDSRDLIQVRIGLTSPERPLEDALFHLEIDNNGKNLISDDLVRIGAGIVEIDLLDPEKWSGNPLESNLGSQSSSLKVYPNPARKVIHLDIPEEEAVLEIFDLQGRIQLRKMVAGPTSLDLLEVGIQSGVYWLKVRSETHSMQKKLIVHPY